MFHLCPSLINMPRLRNTRIGFLVHRRKHTLVNITEVYSLNIFRLDKRDSSWNVLFEINTYKKLSNHMKCLNWKLIQILTAKQPENSTPLFKNKHNAYYSKVWMINYVRFDTKNFQRMGIGNCEKGHVLFIFLLGITLRADEYNCWDT